MSKNKAPKFRPVRNEALYKAMLEIRRSSAATPIPAGQHKGSKSGRKQAAIKASLRGE